MQNLCDPLIIIISELYEFDYQYFFFCALFFAVHTYHVRITSSELHFELNYMFVRCFFFIYFQINYLSNCVWLELEFISPVWSKYSWCKRNSVAHLSSRFWIKDVGRATGYWPTRFAQNKVNFITNSWRLIIFIQFRLLRYVFRIFALQPCSQNRCGPDRLHHLTLRHFARRIYLEFMRWKSKKAQLIMHSALPLESWRILRTLANGEQLNRFDKLLIRISQYEMNLVRLSSIRELRAVCVCRVPIYEFEYISFIHRGGFTDNAPFLAPFRTPIGHAIHSSDCLSARDSILIYFFKIC